MDRTPGVAAKAGFNKAVEDGAWRLRRSVYRMGDYVEMHAVQLKEPCAQHRVGRGR